MLHAKGRFAIITVVVMLMTLLVGFLTGLTGGLAGANVDTVRSWKADRLVMSAPTGAQSASMSTSSISPEAQREWEEHIGQTNVTAIGVTQISASHEENTTGVAIMAHGPGADLGAGTGPNQADDAAAPTGSDVTVSEDAAEELGVQAGSTITVAGHEFTVSEVTGTGHYSHVPVVGMSWTAWQELSERTGGSGQPNALLVHADVSDDDAQAINKAANTVSPAGFDQLLAVGSFRSEVGSLGLMIGMLMAISALVVGAFFTVWTLQRTRDIAVMRALGSP
ncbi:ABC transporter permease [Pseudoglutamicibacter albus]|uniref:ABC transporter permease n=1 Tax=Pseudoglutamicibacter albus TaxID=98671 RepID=UPI0036127877